jgi:beta-glucosidase/6-phospho-beta-glucosidase/beta-galactosidase
VEGDDDCDWTEWERVGRTRGGACGPAVGSWQQYESDADLALQAGANAFRFSISWSRVEPRHGQYDDQALDRYRRLVDHLIDIDIEPIVTLFHSRILRGFTRRRRGHRLERDRRAGSYRRPGAGAIARHASVRCSVRSIL